MANPPTPNQQITSKETLKFNSLVNLVGQVTPLLVGIVTIPMMIQGLGIERFGILTLTWALLGYFSILDFGIGRALIKLISHRIGSIQFNEITAITTTGMILMLAFGVVSGLLLGLLTEPLVLGVFNISVELAEETTSTFYLLSLSMPILLTAVGMRSVLEAHQKFLHVNSIRVPVGILTFLTPVFVLQFTNNLFWVVLSLVIVRVIAWFFYILFCIRILRNYSAKFSYSKSNAIELLRFGGWISVSNFVGPLLFYLDRFFLAGLASLEILAYYTTPYEVITKILILPVAITGVLFPALSSSFSSGSNRAKQAYYEALQYLTYAFIPIILISLLFMEDLLSIWLGPDFASNSHMVAIILTVGVVINGYGLVSQALVQAYGRPDLTAKLHVFELPLYLLYMWMLIVAYGIIGAAVAWLIRVSISAVVLAIMANRSLHKHSLITTE